MSDRVLFFLLGFGAAGLLCMCAAALFLSALGDALVKHELESLRRSNAREWEHLP